MPAARRARLLGPRLSVAVALGVALGTSPACKGRKTIASSSGASASGVPHAADINQLSEAERRYGMSPTRNTAVTYQDDVVIMEHGSDAIQSVAANGLTWTIDAKAPHVDEITPGKIMFATSRAVGRVLAVQHDGGALAVTLGPVAITDVIKDASLSYDQPVDVGSMLTYTAPDYPGAPRDHETHGDSAGAAGDSTGPGDSTTSSTPADTVAVGIVSPNGDLVLPPASPQGGSAQVSAALWTDADRGRFRVMQAAYARQGTRVAPLLAAGVQGLPSEVTFGDFFLTPFCCGGLGIKVTHTAKDLKITAYAVLRLENPSLRVNLVIHGGEIRTAEVELRGGTGLTVQFEVGSAVGLNGNINRTFIVPVDLSIPIVGLAVPVAITLRQTLLLKTAFTSKNGTLTATGDYGFRGSISMGLHNGSWGASAPTSLSTRQNMANSVGGAALGVTGLVFGYGGKVIVGIGAYGFVTGPYLAYNIGVGVTRGADIAAIACRQATLDVALNVGVGYSIPQPVTNAINFILRRLNVKAIEGTGGIHPPEPFKIIHKTDAVPESCRTA